MSLVTDILDHDGGRQVTVWVPARPPTAVVFAADGGRVATTWAPDLAVVRGGAAPLVVGVSGAADEARRLEEYSPAFDPGRFAAHEEFFVDVVGRWVRRRLGLTFAPERTAVFGASAGGELALALGLRHPEVYGTVLAGSPGAGSRPPAAMPDRLPRTYLVAGSGEPFFLANATRWADALRLAGAEVELHERNGTHGDPLWRAEFAAMVAWAFGPYRA